MGEGSARVYNLISLIFLLLTLGVIAFGVTRMMGPAVVTRAAIVVPTALALPTLTPSHTPTVTYTPSPTDPPTSTPTPTITATPTITHTPTATYTPSITPTPAPTLTPTEAPYPFRLRNEVQFTSNFANTAGCQWQGFGGNVFDLDQQPLIGVRIHVYDGSAVDAVAASGSNTLYGNAGWEIQVASAINDRTYFVELRSASGEQLSEAAQVAFPGSCERNVAILYFEQTRAF